PCATSRPSTSQTAADRSREFFRLLEYAVRTSVSAISSTSASRAFLTSSRVIGSTSTSLRIRSSLRLALVEPLQAHELQPALLAVFVLPLGGRDPRDPIRGAVRIRSLNLHQDMPSGDRVWESQPSKLLRFRRHGIGPDVIGHLDPSKRLPSRLEKPIPETAIRFDKVAILALHLHRRAAAAFQHPFDHPPHTRAIALAP